MGPVPWKQEINYASAVLLHPCMRVLLKEFSNAVAIICSRIRNCKKSKHGVDSSVVLDGYTSILSREADGELAELYFTNT